MLEPNPWRLWLAAASACLLTLLATPVVRWFALQVGCVDRPAQNRWGQRVVARLGGIALCAGIMIPALVWVKLDRVFIGLLISGGLIFGLGVVDDLHRLRPYTKLLWQLAIGCCLVMAGIRIELVAFSWFAIPLSIFWFVLVINAFNLLDNMDGLAAGIGAVAAIFCAFHAAVTGQWKVATMAAIVSGACIGFLRYNFPPAKIYMGDSGSHLLGLSLASLALLGTWRHSTQLISILVVPAMVLAVPILDTTFVTIQRLVNRQHPFQGGADHVSHRLAILGLSQQQTVLMLYVVSAAFGLMSLVFVQVKPMAAIGMWLFMVASVLVIGAYLARVRVYAVPAQAPAPPDAGKASSTPIEAMLMHKRRIVEVLVDFSLVGGCYVLAHLLRFEGTLSHDLQLAILQSLPVLFLIKLSCFAGCGLYRGMWRYLGLADLLTIAKAVTLGSGLSALTILYLWRFQGYSRAVMLIDWMACLLAICGARVAERVLDQWILASAEPGSAVVIVGAGDTGARVLRYLTSDLRTGRRVAGFLDDDVRKRGNRIAGVPVLGGRMRLAALLDQEPIREVLIAINDPPGDLLQHIQRCCEPHGVSWKVVTAGVSDVL